MSEEAFHFTERSRLLFLVTKKWVFLALACQSMDGKETLAPVLYPRVLFNPKNGKRAGLTLVPSHKI